MFEKLEVVERRFEELEMALAQPDLDGKELTRISKERAAIEEVVRGFQSLKAIKKSLQEAKDLLEENDESLRDLAKEEIKKLELDLVDTEQKLTLLMLPTDPNDAKNVLVEIRAGTGGEEAALFAADLLRMYTRYAARHGWRSEVMNMTNASAGGLKEAVMLIEGNRVYSRLKFESGVHRVQRVPATEAQGRIHTSACTVAILPEAEEVDVQIRPEDLDIMVCRSSGAGGQSVNTSDSAVRVVHLPSGLVVECQDERSQLKNKDRAIKVLRARLLEKTQLEQQLAINADRKSQVGSGDRSERIRTYNFPQGRLTDHRINLTLYKLPEIMNGDLDEVLDKLGTDHQAQLLKHELEK